MTDLAEFEPMSVFLLKSLSDRYSWILTKSEMDDCIDVALEHLERALLTDLNGAREPTLQRVSALVNAAVADGVVSALTRSRRLAKCLPLVRERLSPREAIVFALRYFGGRPAKAIAAVMRETADTVEGWIGAATAKLQILSLEALC